MYRGGAVKSQLEFHYQIRLGELKEMSFEYLVDPKICTTLCVKTQYQSGGVLLADWRLFARGTEVE